MIQLWMLALAVTSNVTEPPANSAAFDRIQALRAQELQELQAASRARQMQHELTVAAAQQQIEQLGQLPQQITQVGPALSEFELMGVVQGAQQLVVLKHQQQLIRLVPGQADNSGLVATIDSAHVRLQRGKEQRFLTLPRGW
jgi:hypothetical protein